MNPHEDDRALVERCRRELPLRHQAFELLVERYKSMVYTLCLRMTGNASDASDLMQEAFTKAFFHFKSFEGRSAFSSWLYRIAYNECLRHLETRKRETRLMAGYAEQETKSAPAPAGDERTLALQKALDGLSEHYRSALIMKYVMGLETREMADALDLTEGAVKMRLLRAREEFRRLFSREEI